MNYSMDDLEQLIKNMEILDETGKGIVQMVDRMKEMQEPLPKSYNECMEAFAPLLNKITDCLNEYHAIVENDRAKWN